jgi:hypothetical protein
VNNLDPLPAAAMEPTLFEAAVDDDTIAPPEPQPEKSPQRS